MDDLWTLVRFLHVTGAAIWVGGMIALGAVAVPAARLAGDPAAGRRVIRTAARRFGAIGGLTLAVIAASGFGLIHHRGLGVDQLPASDYGRRIIAKMILLVLMAVVALLHGLWQGPRVRRAEDAADEAGARRWRLVGAAFDSFLLLAALATLWLAVSLIP
jgi:putative copper export protein